MRNWNITVSVTVWMGYFRKRHTCGEGGDWGHGISKENVEIPGAKKGI